MSIFQRIVDKIRGKKTRDEYSYKEDWRQVNPHNDVSIENNFDFSKVKVGNRTYGSIYVYTSNAQHEGLSIGHFCSLALGTTFLLHNGHRQDLLSTFPFKEREYNQPCECDSKGRIIIGDDVWIGKNVTILPKVNIGQGAVVALGSVVTKDVEPYSLVGGVPARHIKYRFEKDVRDKLLRIDYSKIDESFIKNNQQLLTTKITLENIDKLMQKFPLKNIEVLQK